MQGVWPRVGEVRPLLHAVPALAHGEVYQPRGRGHAAGRQVGEGQLYLYKLIYYILIKSDIIAL